MFDVLEFHLLSAVSSKKKNEKILETFGVTLGNSSVVLGVKLVDEEGHAQELSEAGMMKYKYVVATANHVAQDRPDVRFAVKDLCLVVAKRTNGSWKKKKKLPMYLKGRARVVQKIKLGGEGIANEVQVVVDSGWVGCIPTRRSTNEGCIIVGDVWRAQSVAALGSGSAEYCAATKRACEGFGFLAGCADLGIWNNESLTLKVLTDSSACKGICQRPGSGKG